MTPGLPPNWGACFAPATCAWDHLPAQVCVICRDPLASPLSWKPLLKRIFGTNHSTPRNTGKLRRGLGPTTDQCRNTGPLITATPCRFPTPAPRAISTLHSESGILATPWVCRQVWGPCAWVLTCRSPVYLGFVSVLPLQRNIRAMPNKTAAPTRQPDGGHQGPSLGHLMGRQAEGFYDCGLRG